MENAAFFLTAFIVVWAVVFGYVLFLVNRQAKLRHELDSLREELKAGETKR